MDSRDISENTGQASVTVKGRDREESEDCFPPEEAV